MKAIDKAKEAVGGAKALARRLTEAGRPITSQAITQWDIVPAKRAKDVALITGIPLHELRPDLWSEPSSEAAE